MPSEPWDLCLSVATVFQEKWQVDVFSSARIAGFDETFCDVVCTKLFLIQIDGVFNKAEQFFSLAPDCKSKYSRTAHSNNNGYVDLLEERYMNNMNCVQILDRKV